MEIRINPAISGNIPPGEPGLKSTAEKPPSRDFQPQGDGVELSGDSSITGSSDAQKSSFPAGRPSPSEYHFKPKFPVTSQNGRWVMHLPNAKIPLPGKPRWLETIQKENQILDGSSDPLTLRNWADEIKSIADKSYLESGKFFDETPLREFVDSMEDGKMVGDLLKIYQMRLDNETMSTNQVGGAMAGTSCSEMAKYGKIVPLLKDRLKNLLA